MRHHSIPQPGRLRPVSLWIVFMLQVPVMAMVVGNGNINGNDKLQFYLASLLYYNRTINIELLLLY